MRVGDNHQKNAAGRDQLVTALKQGVPDAWRETLAEFGPGLEAYASRMLGNSAMGEDVVQEALLYVYRTIERFDGKCSIKSWLYRAVRNRAIDEIRRQKRYVDVGKDPADDFFKEDDGHWRDDCHEWDGRAARELDGKKLLKIVHGELDNLPHAYREVLLLKEVDGFEVNEICEALEISSGNLRIRLHRARSVLRAAVRSKLNKE